MNESPRTVFLGVAALLVMVALVVGGVVTLQRVTATRAQVIASEARSRARALANEARDRAREIDAEARADLASDLSGEAVARVVLDAVRGLLDAAEQNLGAGRPQAAEALMVAAIDQLDRHHSGEEWLPGVLARRRAAQIAERLGLRDLALAQIHESLRRCGGLADHPQVSVLTAELEAESARLRGDPVNPEQPGPHGR
ncbi:MAG: hypothetical protein JNK35_12195 [Phycisphaerae bacterium]|nr:hypothetical protein [Phycisphaerae bacterium]